MRKLLFVAITLLLISCNKKEADQNFSSKRFEQAIKNKDSGNLMVEFKKLTIDLVGAEPTSSNNCGHKTTFETLKQRVKAFAPNCEMDILCICCYYSLPPKSDVVLKYNENGMVYEHRILINTPVKEEIGQ